MSHFGFLDDIGMKPIDLDNVGYHQVIDKTEFVNGREAAPLSIVQPSDLISYGMIPEVIGSVPVLATLH
ncbi:hypothetical protein NADFUDRAFT_84303 [Nadsonia fulvescens var. elongata DSM 6958]|uniref:Uncharacterized protein n=1 Tax=Nadsonia fulvescens var. elongata DSM 6958 TaxID=857566 RepID=A0A1E3PE52_9ASCO|nr:hypothetical protein NADFUDRAFT_84303 [Nadsonia fulvescens var. elongata DSM 6958]